MKSLGDLNTSGHSPQGINEQLQDISEILMGALQGILGILKKMCGILGGSQREIYGIFQNTKQNAKWNLKGMKDAL